MLFLLDYYKMVVILKMKYCFLVRVLEVDVRFFFWNKGLLLLRIIEEKVNVKFFCFGW